MMLCSSFSLYIIRYATLAALVTLAAQAASTPAPAPFVKLPAVAPVSLVPSANLEGPPGSREISGLVASKTHPGVFWAHNDSGDQTRIYPVNRAGKIIKSARSDDAPGVFIGGVINSDWEDIALDASGRVIIADVGNNSNARKDLVLQYVIEPEPTVGFAPLFKSVFIRYPEQKSWPAEKSDFNYDCEGIFTKGDTVYFVTKRRSDSLTRLYRLDSPITGAVNDLTPLADFDIRGRATASDASPDGKRLAILTYEAVWLFEAATPGGDDWFAGSVWWLPFKDVKGAEALAFDGEDTLLIGAEEGAGKIYPVKISDLHRVR
jgi:hypothetical protein